MNCQKLNRTTRTNCLADTTSLLTDSTMKILSVSEEKCSWPITKTDGKANILPYLRFSWGIKCIQSFCMKHFNSTNNNISLLSQLASQNNSTLNWHFGASHTIALLLLPHLFNFFSINYCLGHTKHPILH